MRLRLIALLLSGIVAASSGCAVDATAPSSFTAPQGAAMAKGEQHGQSRDERLEGPVTTYRVTIDPKRPNVLRFGEHTLTIPGHAICRISTSGYGPLLFGDACVSEKRPLGITARVRTSASGLPHIDLQPELRFSPDKTVTLALYVRSFSATATNWTILYCATPLLAACVDESRADPSLTTNVDYPSHTLFRRIKHFSGYFVSE
jgi:hypothetical protein